MQENNPSAINTVRHDDLNAVQLVYSIVKAGKESSSVHAHSKLELSLILSGSGVYHTPKRDYHVGPGDIYFFRSNESHDLTTPESGEVVLLSLYIAPYYLYTDSYRMPASACMGLLSFGQGSESHRLNDFAPVDQINMIASGIRNIWVEMQHEESNFDICVKYYISIILIYLSRILWSNQAEDNAARASCRKIGAAIDFINQHFRENMTLDVIAEQVGYSRSHFSAEFHKWMGMTTWNYISIKRIEEALSLIKTSNLSILEIALSCGFNNTANFGKTFKKYTNLPPSSFRP